MHSTCYSCLPTPLSAPSPTSSSHCQHGAHKSQIIHAATPIRPPTRTRLSRFGFCSRHCDCVWRRCVWGACVCVSCFFVLPAGSRTLQLCISISVAGLHVWKCGNAWKMENALGNSNAQLHTLSAFYCISRVCVTCLVQLVIVVIVVARWCCCPAMTPCDEFKPNNTVAKCNCQLQPANK